MTYVNQVVVVVLAARAIVTVMVIIIATVIIIVVQMTDAWAIVPTATIIPTWPIVTTLVAVPVVLVLRLRKQIKISVDVNGVAVIKDKRQHLPVVVRDSQTQTVVHGSRPMVRLAPAQDSPMPQLQRVLVLVQPTDLQPLEFRDSVITILVRRDSLITPRRRHTRLVAVAGVVMLAVQDSKVQKRVRKHMAVAVVVAATPKVIMVNHLQMIFMAVQNTGGRNRLSIRQLYRTVMVTIRIIRRKQMGMSKNLLIH